MHLLPKSFLRDLHCKFIFLVEGQGLYYHMLHCENLLNACNYEYGMQH